MSVIDKLKAFVRHVVRRPILEIGDRYGDSPDVGWDDLKKVVAVGDPIKTAMGSIANIANKAKTIADVIIKGAPSLFVPFLSTKYEQIEADALTRQKQIESAFPEIFSHARKVWPDDASLALFALEPVWMTSAAVGSASLDVVLDLTDALAGHTGSVMKYTQKLRPRRRTAAEGLSLRSVMREAHEQDPSSVFSDRAFMHELNSCRNVRVLKEKGTELLKQYLDSIKKSNNEIQGASSEDLKSMGVNIADVSDDELFELKSQVMQVHIAMVDKFASNIKAKIPENALDADGVIIDDLINEVSEEIRASVHA